MFPEHVHSVVLPKPYPTRWVNWRGETLVSEDDVVEKLARTREANVFDSRSQVEAVVSKAEDLREVMQGVWWDELLFARQLGERLAWEPAAACGSHVEWRRNTQLRDFSKRKDRACIVRWDFVILAPFSFACFVDLAAFGADPSADLMRSLERIEARYAL